MSPLPVDPGPFEQWPSYDYWTESDERRAQHWYICFCLMMSSAQDWLTGVSLKSAGNLNWAATASYYSTVHCGRMLCFTVCGDFPTQHNKLRELFVAESHEENDRAGPRRQTTRSASSGARYQFDWLRRFAASNYSGRERSTPNRSGAAIAEALRTLAPHLETELDALCPRFSALGALRNDSNYESLLIAHEANHPFVTEQFELLASRALTLAKRAASLSRDVFLAYVNCDGRLEDRRRAFKTASAAYFDERLQRGLRSKLGRAEAPRQALEGYMNEPAIAELGTGDRSAVQSIEEQISMDLFDSKTSLMHSFEQKVAALG